MEVGKAPVAYQDDDGGRRISALSMYPEPPTEPIGVTEFEDFALDRLRRASAKRSP